MKRLCGLLAMGCVLAACGGDDAAGGGKVEIDAATKGSSDGVTVELAADTALVTVPKSMGALVSMKCEAVGGGLMFDGELTAVDPEVGQAAWGVRAEEGEDPIPASRAYSCTVVGDTGQRVKVDMTPA